MMVIEWNITEDVFDVMYEPLAGANTTTLLRCWGRIVSTSQADISPSLLSSMMKFMT